LRRIDHFAKSSVLVALYPKQEKEEEKKRRRRGSHFDTSIHRLNRTLFGPRRVGGRWAAVPSTVVDETSMGHGCGFLAL
jgi:hypothetical protein